jgi:hypothetical protein
MATCAGRYATSVIERLPSLSDDARFGPLVAKFPGLPRAARDAQAEALDRVLTTLASELALFHELVVWGWGCTAVESSWTHSLKPPGCNP